LRTLSYKSYHSFLLGILAPVLYHYKIGFDDHAIQISFAKKLGIPSLYPNDPLMQTLADYPSFFPRLISLLFKHAIPFEPFYYSAYILSYGLLFVAIHQLADCLFKNARINLLSVLLLLLPSLSLGGSSAYLAQFYPSLLVLPWIVFCLNLFLSGKYAISFIGLGLLANLHSLLAAYAFACMSTYIVYNLIKEKGNRFHKLMYPLLFILFASPTIYWSLSADQHQYSNLWHSLMRLRSSHHSYPFSWAYEKLIMYGLFFSAFIFTLFIPLKIKRDRKDIHQKEKIVAFVICICSMCVIGTFFTEFLSVPILIKLQLFRSSIYLNLFASIFFAAVVDYCINKDAPPLFTALIFSILFIPYNSLNYGLLFVSCLFLAIQSRYYTSLTLKKLPSYFRATLSIVFLLLIVVVIVNSCTTNTNFYQELFAHWKYLLIWGFSLLLLLILQLKIKVKWPSKLALLLLATSLSAYYYQIVHLKEKDQNDWLNTQKWAREHTDVKHIFLTPPKQTGFRVFSERSIIGEWKDGTQLYFSPDFAQSWKARMTALEVHEFNGKGYSYLLKNQLDELHLLYPFQYIVAPLDAELKNRKVLYSNKTFKIVQY